MSLLFHSKTSMTKSSKPLPLTSPTALYPPAAIVADLQSINLEAVGAAEAGDIDVLSYTNRFSTGFDFQYRFYWLRIISFGSVNQWVAGSTGSLQRLFAAFPALQPPGRL